jgi:hypothetical protein
MHMEHCKPVEDAAWLHEGQHVLMATKRAAVVKTIKATTILFQYLGSNRSDDFIEVPRHRIPEFVRI